MNMTLAFTRTFFFILSVFFMTTFALAKEMSAINLFIGVSAGILIAMLLYGLDVLFKKYNLRSFNVTLIGLFFGYLMGQALYLIFNKIMSMSVLTISLQPQIKEMAEIFIFLLGIYLGTIMTIKSADELTISLPFIKFYHSSQKKKDLLADGSVLSDSRTIDLAASGLIDHHLVIPRFVVKELYAIAETGDELSKAKAKRSLETLKKLEELPNLGLRYNDTDFPELNDQSSKLIRLARLIDANILSADISRVQISSLDGIPVINLHGLSNALKPLMQTGEVMKIKIQRYGKEPRQGVGYLEDGTMVVVNGGGEYIGEIIEVQVLSVKHTASGRMIFCNAMESDEYYNQIQYEEQHEKV